MKKKFINSENKDMSIMLYIKETEIPDLEAKIAYGLARVWIEEGYDWYYKILF